MRILVVRFKSLGDIVLTTPAVEALKRSFPSAEIEYVADDVFAPILEKDPNLSRVHAFPRARLGRMWAARRLLEDADSTLELARRRYEVVVDLHGSPRAAWLTFLTGAPVRVGFAHVRVRNLAYTTRVTIGEEASRHTANIHLALARAAGARTPEDPTPRVHLTDDERASARERLGGLAGKPFIAIHPGATRADKRWPEERFAELARRAKERFSLPSAVFAGRAEKATGRAIAAGSGSKLFTDLSIRELAALMGEAAVFCGNDSGPMHLAAAVGVPVLAVFGPTTPVRWRPLVAPSRVVTPPTEGGAAGDVPLDEVEKSFSELLREARLV